MEQYLEGNEGRASTTSTLHSPRVLAIGHFFTTAAHRLKQGVQLVLDVP